MVRKKYWRLWNNFNAKKKDADKLDEEIEQYKQEKI